MYARKQFVWILAAIMALAGADPVFAGGRVHWRFEIPHNFPGQFVGVGADGRIYTTSFDPGTLYALEPDGSLVWTLGLGGAAAHWPIGFGADGTIYTGSASRVCAVNPDGTLRWVFDSRFNFGDWLIAGPTVGPDGNIYAANDRYDPEDLGFFSLDADGNLRWSDRGDPAIFGLYSRLDDIVFGAGRFFAGINFRRSGPWINTYAFDLDGHQLWNRANVGIEGGPSSNPRMLPDGRLVFRWGQGSLAALNQDGTDDWLVPHPDGAQMLTTPAVGPDGAIYAGDSYGVQLWSAGPDGSTRWVLGSDILEHLTTDSVGVSPDNGVVVVGGWTWTDPINIGWFRGYDPADGTLLWQVDLLPEQGWPQYPHTTKPAFSPNGDTAYVTASFAGDGVGHSYLYAIATADTPTALLRSTAITFSIKLLRNGQVSVTGVVTVKDEDNAPVSGAKVAATWTLPNGRAQNKTASTDTAGQAAFSIKGGRGTYTLTVTNITKTGYTFDSAGSILIESIDNVTASVLGEPIPAVSTWGMLVMALLLSVCATVVLRAKTHPAML